MVTILGMDSPLRSGFDSHDLTMRLDFGPGDPKPTLVIELPGFDIHLSPQAGDKLVRHAEHLLGTL